jgi:hypothetical protein
MKHPIVFYLTEQKISDHAGSIKLLYVEHQEYWNRHHCLSPLPVELPLAVQMHMELGIQLTGNIFEVTNPNLTDEDFVRAGFIKDVSLAEAVEDARKYENKFAFSE